MIFFFITKPTDPWLMIGATKHLKEMYIINFDKEYLKWARLLVMSNLSVNQDEKMYLSTVNLTNEDIESLYAINENLIIEYEVKLYLLILELFLLLQKTLQFLCKYKYFLFQNRLK